MAPAAAAASAAPPDRDPNREWFSVPRLAQHLGTGPRTIYNAVLAGELRAAKVNGRGDIRIHRTWAMTWMAKRSQRRADRRSPSSARRK